MQSLRPIVGAVLCSSLVLAAQKTLIVDVNKGQGYTHQTLASAFRAASNGDTIIIRRGTYLAANTGKALTLLGEGRPTLGGSMTISALAVGKYFTIDGIHFDRGRVTISNCRGTVTLANLTGGKDATGLGVTVATSTLVMINNCEINAGGGAALSIAGSTVSLVGSIVTGKMAQRILGRGTPGEPAIVSQNSYLSITNSLVRGGKGLPPGGGHGSNYHAVPGGVGISQNSGFLVFDRAQIGGGNSASPITSNNGQVRYNPVLFSRSSISGSSRQIHGTISSVEARGAAPNGTASVTVRGETNDSCIPAVSLLLPGRVAVPGLGSLFLDTRVMTLGPAGKLDAIGAHYWNPKVPNIPSFRGLVLGVQAVVDHKGKVSLSEPTAMVLN